jgi:hypothetical protein
VHRPRSIVNRRWSNPFFQSSTVHGPSSATNLQPTIFVPKTKAFVPQTTNRSILQELPITPPNNHYWRIKTAQKHLFLEKPFLNFFYSKIPSSAPPVLHVSILQPSIRKSPIAPFVPRKRQSLHPSIRQSEIDNHQSRIPSPVPRPRSLHQCSCAHQSRISPQKSKITYPRTPSAFSIPSALVYSGSSSKMIG